LYGVKLPKPGFKRLRIEPHKDLLATGEGTFVTSAGKIKLKWTDGNLEVEISTDVEQRLCLGVQCILFDLLPGRQSISSKRQSLW
jgi:hypothetical protein